MNEYRSVVYYQVKQPRWMETVKVIIIIIIIIIVINNESYKDLKQYPSRRLLVCQAMEVVAQKVSILELLIAFHWPRTQPL